jgi:hypothetical protein
VRFTTIVPRVGLIGRFFGPLEDLELRIVTVDYNPPVGFVALLAANLTSINHADHRKPPVHSRYARREQCDTDFGDSGNRPLLLE